MIVMLYFVCSVHSGKAQTVLAGLMKAERKHPQLHVHQKSSALLKSLNYTNSARIAPIVLTADEGWYIVTRGEHLINPDSELV